MAYGSSGQRQKRGPYFGAIDFGTTDIGTAMEFSERNQNNRIPVLWFYVATINSMGVDEMEMVLYFFQAENLPVLRVFRGQSILRGPYILCSSANPSNPIP